MLADNGIVREIDVMLPRKDAKDPNVKGHKGIKSDVNPNYSIEDDLERRDITINAVAIGLDGKIIDKGGLGQQDMKNGTIRAVSADAFLEDPLRMLRAIRFTARFDFNIDPATLKLIRDNVRLLSDKSELPAERFLMEFKKMIGKADLGKAVKLLIDLGMYDAIFGVPSKITDFTKFDKAKNLGEFAFMLFEEQPLETITNLVLNNITNEDAILNYVNSIIEYIKNVKGKNLNKGARINALAKIFKVSSKMLLESTYVDEEDRVIANKFVSGELPKGDHDVALKGGEFQQFIAGMVEAKFNRKFIKADGRYMGMAKKLALQAVYDEIIPNDEGSIRQYLETNVNKWLV
jgi:tRNA nucleotidyltransferase/poly(A) polymerase